MNYQEMLKKLEIIGASAYRAGWKDRNIFLGMQYPLIFPGDYTPFLFIKNTEGPLSKFRLSPEDLLSDDWQVK